MRAAKGARVEEDMVLYPVTFGQTPPLTFEQLELAKIQAMHDLPPFHMKMAWVSSDDKGAPIRFEVDLLRNHDQYRMSAKILPSGAEIKSVCDGKRIVITYQPQMQFTERAITPSPSFDPQKFLVKCPPDSLNFAFTQDNQLGFAADPPFEMKPLENVTEAGANLRLATGTTTGKSGRKTTIHEWFYADKWIMKRFDVTTESPVGPVTMRGEVSLLAFPKVNSQEFSISPAFTQGFVKKGP